MDNNNGIEKDVNVFADPEERWLTFTREQAQEILDIVYAHMPIINDVPHVEQLMIYLDVVFDLSDYWEDYPEEERVKPPVVEKYDVSFHREQAEQVAEYLKTCPDDHKYKYVYQLMVDLDNLFADKKTPDED